MINGTTASLPSKRSLYSAFGKVDRGENLQPRGSSGLLSDAETVELMKCLDEFENKYCVMTNSVICQEAAVIFLRRFEVLADIPDSSPVWVDIQKGLRTIFVNNHFVYRIRKELCTVKKSSRGMEYFRARKYQPELLWTGFASYCMLMPCA